MAAPVKVARGPSLKIEHCLAMQLVAAAHLAHIDLMMAEGWGIEGEQVLRAWLAHRIERQDEDEPASLN